MITSHRILLIVFCIWSTGINAINRNWTAENYTPDHYGSNFESVNFAIAQAPNGLLYFGNANGILEFDGYTWRYLPVRQGAWIRSITITEEGTIYAGCQNEFGYFVPDSVGTLQYQSLSASLPDTLKAFSDVWNAYSLNDTVVFQSDEYLFYVTKKDITVLRPKTSFHSSFKINNQIIIRQRNIGLQTVQNKQFTPFLPQVQFADIGVFSIINHNQRVLIATPLNGLWCMSQDSAKLWNCPVNTHLNLSKSIVSTIVSLGDMGIAIGTMNSGIFIANSVGEITDHIDQTNGLANNCINSLYVNEGNLWATTNGGIARIQIPETISKYSANAGITAAVNTITKHQHILYVATADGLFAENDMRLWYSDPEFIPIWGFDKHIWDILSVGNNLYIGTNDGLYRYQNQATELIAQGEFFSLLFNPSDSTIFAGGSQGLYVIDPQTNNTNQIIADFPVNKIAHKEHVSDTSELWLGSNYRGVLRILWHDNKGVVARDLYTTEDGLNQGWVIPIPTEHGILFNSNGQFLSFIKETSIIESLPDSIRYNAKYNRGYFDYHEIPFRQSVISYCSDTSSAWISDGLQILMKTSSDTAFQTKQDLFLGMGKINNLKMLDGAVWACTENGLAMLPQLHRKETETPRNCLIRSVSTDDGFQMFNGTHHDGQKNLRLPYGKATISFLYATPHYTNQFLEQYSYKLVGLMDEWSAWKHDIKANFNNLSEGKYTFKVRSISVSGVVSETDLFSFSVLPPWYRSVWAYIAYGFLTIATIYLIVKLNTRRLSMQNLQLEKTVADRTKEIEGQKMKLEQKNSEILNQQAEITDSINYARQIQSALLPDFTLVSNYTADSFVLWKPRDIVSGDFYWFSEVDDTLIAVAADCTGHGVPGAFMSMLGMSFLNTIVNERAITDPGTILTRLRDYVIQSLRQEQGTSSKDGMDICLLCLKKGSKTVSFAGAYNPLIQLSKGTVTEHSTDRMPVAIYESSDPFITRTITVESGDCLYMYSDGICDQFGGPKNKKFFKKNFKKLLAQTAEHPLQEQAKIIDQTIEEYRGANDQTDDIVVVGLKIG